MCNRSFVYFLKDDKKNLIKIGYSKNIVKRVKSLRRIHGKHLELMCVIRGDKILEQRIHTELNKYRVIKEWFHCNEEVKKYLLTLDVIEIFDEEEVYSLFERVSPVGRILKSYFNDLLIRKIVQDKRIITLSDVSKETGISIKTLENTWANDNPDGIDQLHIPTVDILCQYFECNIDDLVGFQR